MLTVFYYLLSKCEQRYRFYRRPVVRISLASNVDPWLSSYGTSGSMGTIASVPPGLTNRGDKRAGGIWDWELFAFVVCPFYTRSLVLVYQGLNYSGLQSHRVDPDFFSGYGCFYLVWMA